MTNEIRRLLDLIGDLTEKVSGEVKMNIKTGIEKAAGLATDDMKPYYKSIVDKINWMENEHETAGHNIERIWQELKHLVILAFSKSFDRKGSIVDWYSGRGFAWQLDEAICMKIGLQFDAQPTLTDCGWRTHVRFDTELANGPVPACLEQFMFDLDSCSDSYLRSENNIHAFVEHAYGASLPRYTEIVMCDADAREALDWLRSHSALVRLTME